jgi:hypothetical protein
MDMQQPAKQLDCQRTTDVNRMYHSVVGFRRDVLLKVAVSEEVNSVSLLRGSVLAHKR